MKKMLFIVNPKAGRTTLKNCLIDVIDVFCKKEYEVRNLSDTGSRRCCPCRKKKKERTTM